MKSFSQNCVKNYHFRYDPLKARGIPRSRLSFRPKKCFFHGVVKQIDKMTRLILIFRIRPQCGIVNNLKN